MRNEKVIDYRHKYGKIFGVSVIALALLVSAFVLLATPVEAGGPTWPGSWNLIDTDPTEDGISDDYRDVQMAYYNEDSDFLYLRLECYGNPVIAAEPDARYKWFIETGTADMYLSGGNIIGAEYLFFIEDTDDDGNADIYLDR